jgi:tRNA nucleotidyltransferase (CCA-adding enzyme)
MKIYLVGGAVRDEILGRECHDYDYVVVGSSVEEMLQKGFIQVGNDFPVFLHPVTKDEYSLARKETKTKPGYKGFEFGWENVTLEEDLFRRDLTINAIAKDLESGEYIDPFNGIVDIKKRILKHVSEHFVQDPTRVLRTGRFLAQLNDFSVDLGTKALCREIALGDELDHLTRERIWKELVKVLHTNHGYRFFEFLRTTGALEKFFPELSQLYGVPCSDQTHLEEDLWTHTMQALKNSCKLSEDINIRFSLLLHTLDRGGVEKVCDRFMVPRNTKKLSMKISTEYLEIHSCMDAEPSSIVQLLKRIEAFRNEQFFENVLIACKAEAYGETKKDYPQEDFLLFIAKSINAINTETILKNVAPEKIKDIVFDEQVKVAEKAIQKYASLKTLG